MKKLVLNDYTNTMKVTDSPTDDPLPKKAKVDESGTVVVDPRAEVKFSKTGQNFYFSSSSNITLNFS